MKKITIFLLAMLLSSNAYAFNVKHHFTVFIGPFNASQTSFEYGLTPKNYFVSSNIKTAGVFNTLYPFEAVYSTTGRIKNNNLETDSYKYKSKSRFTRRSKELIYNEKGEPIYSVTVKNDKEKKKAILQAADNKNTTDLQTVFAEMAKQYNKLRFCDSRMEVFDGKRRYDVIFKDEGVENLTKNKYSPFEGRANKCSMYIDKLASKDDDLLWQTTSEKPIYFWIMEDDEHSVPFIAKVIVNETPLGAVEVYTNKIEVTK